MSTPLLPGNLPPDDAAPVERCRAMAAELAPRLLAWYESHGRSLPWRLAPSPYRTWVSEIMLQQTQVATVVPYYQRFLDRFPDVETLARAELSELLALWQGLGYYSRARNLHAAARQVVQRHQGVVPLSRTELLALPGVGDYTAGAILSIAHNLDYVAVDGNVKRILARILDYDRQITGESTVSEIVACAQALLPTGQASKFNQALMDLGAMICLPRGPQCSRCPVATLCLARERGVQELRPVRASRSPVPVRNMVGAHLEQSDGGWLALHRLPRGLLGGLWEMPMFEWEDAGGSPRERLLLALQEELQIDASCTGEPLLVTHAYTHFRVRLLLFRCNTSDTPVLSSLTVWDDLCWLDESRLTRHGLTGLTLKALRATQQPQLL